jgi:hypothetical protein
VTRDLRPYNHTGRTSASSTSQQFGVPLSPWRAASDGSVTGDSTHPIGLSTSSEATCEMSMRLVTDRCGIARMVE